MQTKILIGSVLKPVDDVRHYHKIAKSLLKKDSEIHIFGYHSDTKSEDKRIVFHSSKAFNRLSFARLAIHHKFLFLALKIKPNIIICGTHELLKASNMIKLLTGAKVIYDIRENYYRNIINTTTFPFLIKYPLAFIVRLNEHIQSLFVNHFLLAEKCYVDELSFLNENKTTVLENKLMTDTSQHTTHNTHRTSRKFIITGTLGELYGTQEGINFFKEINKLKSEVTLSITGFCRSLSLYQQLQTSNFELRISSTDPIPHSEIIKVLEKEGTALLPYQTNKSTANKVPTKFYEYLYYKIPMIIQKNETWEDFLKPYKAAIFINFNKFDPQEVLTQLEDFDFYSGKEVGDEILWKSEEEKLLNLELIKNEI